MTVDRENQAASCSQDPASILKHFAMLPDPRREHGRLHPLDEILFMAVCAVLCGADTWQEIADYAESKRDWLKSFLALAEGVPSPDTFRRVFCLLDPLAFQTCFFDWMTALMNRSGLTLIPLDRSELKPIALALGQRLVGGEPPDVGPSRDRGEIERDHGDSRTA